LFGEEFEDDAPTNIVYQRHTILFPRINEKTITVVSASPKMTHTPLELPPKTNANAYALTSHKMPPSPLQIRKLF
jgi:hypothetical protein